MNRRAPFAVWAVVGLLALLLTPSDAAAQLGEAQIRNVRFEGNNTFSGDSLARAIVTRETECKSLVFVPFCLFGADWAEQKYYLRQPIVPVDMLRLQVWYRRRGFRDTQVDTATIANADGTADVLFRISEGRPVLVDSIEILGADGFDDIRLLEELPLEVGDALNDLLLDATQDTIRRRLQNQGYAHADVLKSFIIPSETPFQALVSYDVAPGPRSRYGHIEVTVTGEDGDTASASLTTSTVLKTLQFRTGDLYRLDQRLDAQARLYGLEVVRSARVEVDSLVTASDSVISLDVHVQEGDVHRVRAGGGWSSAECFDVESRWISRNFRGGGRRLQVRGRLSNLGAPQFHTILCPQLDEEPFQKLSWLAAVDFAQPWIFSTRNSFSASLYGERQSIPDAFVREALGLSLALTRNIGPRTPLTLSYQPELSRLDAAEVLFCTSFLVCSPDDIASLQGANWLSPVGINFSRNSANNILNPTRGYTMVIDLEHAAPWTGSDFRYDRAIIDGAVYERMTPSSVLAARLRAGWVGAGAFDEFLGIENRASVEGVHPQKRFYGGGANSVRGFAQSRLGPLVLTADPGLLMDSLGVNGGAGCSPQELMSLSCDAGSIEDADFLPRPTGGTRVLEGSVEARFPLSSRLQGVAFTDFGQVWGGDDVVSLASTEITPGVGVRVMSPIGPIRLDVAYRFLGGQLLPLVTPRIRPFIAGQDDLSDRLSVDGEKIEYVKTEELVVLTPFVLWGESPALSLRRFQIHVSIGQAF